MYPNQRQKEILNNWLGTARRVYNKTLEYIKKSKECVKISFQKLRNKFVTNRTGKNKVKNPNVEEWELKTPKEIRAYSVKNLVNAYKSAFSNLKNHNIAKFNINYKRKKSNRDNITIQKQSISIKNNDNQKSCCFIYKRYIKDPIKLCNDKFLQNEFDDIECDCKIQKIHNNWFLIIPYTIRNKDYHPKYNVCALDPGVNTFQTLYSPEQTVQFHQNKNKIVSLYKKSDLMQQLKDTSKITAHAYKKSIGRIYTKLDNEINELHNKTINYILKHYKTILLPSFDSQKMMGKYKYCNKWMCILKHYQFKIKLQNKVNLSKSNLIICTEEYTSKTCTQCGKLCDKLSLSDRTFKCKCGLKINRDINGARNIYIKNMI